jgi:hypothetical protein
VAVFPKLVVAFAIDFLKRKLKRKKNQVSQVTPWAAISTSPEGIIEVKKDHFRPSPDLFAIIYATRGGYPLG